MIATIENINEQLKNFIDKEINNIIHIVLKDLLKRDIKENDLLDVKLLTKDWNKFSLIYSNYILGNIILDINSFNLEFLPLKEIKIFNNNIL